MAKKAVGETGVGSINRKELTVKKAVFSLDSSILYILTANTEPSSPRHSNCIFALNIDSIEGYTSTDFPASANYIKIVDHFPLVPEYDIHGVRLWPEELSDATFNPEVIIQETPSVYTDFTSL